MDSSPVLPLVLDPGWFSYTCTYHPSPIQTEVAPEAASSFWALNSPPCHLHQCPFQSSHHQYHPLACCLLTMIKMYSQLLHFTKTSNSFLILCPLQARFPHVVPSMHHFFFLLPINSLIHCNLSSALTKNIFSKRREVVL